MFPSGGIPDNLKPSATAKPTSGASVSYYLPGSIMLLSFGMMNQHL
jgi:hypothetical protein